MWILAILALEPIPLDLNERQLTSPENRPVARPAASGSWGHVALRILRRWTPLVVESKEAHWVRTSLRRRRAAFGTGLRTIDISARPGLISIVLASCDQPSSLVEGLKRHLRLEWEVVVVVGSPPTDQALDTSIRYLDAGGGIAEPITLGIDAARGEFVTWAEDAAHLDPECLDRLAEALRAERPGDTATSPQRLPMCARKPAEATFLVRAAEVAVLGPPRRRWGDCAGTEFRMRLDAFAGTSSLLPDETVAAAKQPDRLWRELAVCHRQRLAAATEPALWLMADDGGPGGRALRGSAEAILALRRQCTVKALDAVDWALPPTLLPAIALWCGDARADPRDHFPALPPTVPRICLASAADSPHPDWDVVAAPAERPSEASIGDRRVWRYRDLADALSAMDAHARCRESVTAAASQGNDVAISVVLCSYRRRVLIAPCLRALLAQTLPADLYEIIVVDNEPGDQGGRIALRTIVAEVVDARPTHHVRVVDCPLLGLSHARNAGLATARGRIVAYIDDDAIAAPDWLAALLRGYTAGPDVGVVGGEIILVAPEPRPPVLRRGRERFWSDRRIAATEAGATDEWWNYPWGANWSADRQALLAIGGFPTGWGRKGDDFSGGEEVVAAHLLRELGFQIVLQPAAKVEHRVQTHRFTYRHLWRTVLAGVLSHATMHRELLLPGELTTSHYIRQLRHHGLTILRAVRHPSAGIDIWENCLQFGANAIALGRYWRHMASRLRRAGNVSP